MANQYTQSGMTMTRPPQPADADTVSVNYDVERFAQIQELQRKNPDLTQRAIAKELGLTFGQVSGCIYRQKEAEGRTLVYEEPSQPRTFSFETQTRAKTSFQDWGTIRLGMHEL